MQYIYARLVFGVARLFGLAMMIAGVFMLFGGAGIGAGIARDPFLSPLAAYVGALPGMYLFLIGLFFTAGVEHMSATVDMAESTSKILRVAEEDLRVSKEALRIGQFANPGYADLQDEEEPRRGFLSRIGFGRRAEQPAGAEVFARAADAPPTAEPRTAPTMTRDHRNSGLPSPDPRRDDPMRVEPANEQRAYALLRD